ncbi:MAG: twin-arginine translocation signal domain-containing protein, partial [Gaiellaceae bacterium]
MPDEVEKREFSRRDLLKRAGVGAAGVAVSGTFAEPVWARAKTWEANNTIKLGFVSPLTGSLAGFGEGDPYIIGL